MRHPAALTKGQAMATATLSPSPSPATSHGRSGARILVGLILGSAAGPEPAWILLGCMSVGGAAMLLLSSVLSPSAELDRGR